MMGFKKISFIANRENHGRQPVDEATFSHTESVKDAIRYEAEETTAVRPWSFINVEKIERDLAVLVFRSRHRVLLFILTSCLLVTSSYIPYLDWFVNFFIVFSVTVLLAPLILDINSKVIFATGIFLFFVAFLLWSLSMTEESETLVEYIYIILLSGSLRAMFAD